MEDIYDDIANLPNALQRQIMVFRKGREIGLRELVEEQSRNFARAIERELWRILLLPGPVQPELASIIVGALLAEEIRKLARMNVCKANALRLANYWQTTREQEADLRRVHAISLHKMSTTTGLIS